MASFNFKAIRTHLLLLTLVPLAFMAISFFNAKAVIGTLEANLEKANEVQGPSITHLGTMKAEMAKIDKWMSKAVVARDNFKLYEADTEIRRSIEKMDEALEAYSAIPVDDENVEAVLAIKSEWPEIRDTVLQSLGYMQENNADVAAVMMEEKFEPLSLSIQAHLEVLANESLRAINYDSVSDAKMVAEGRNFILTLTTLAIIFSWGLATWILRRLRRSTVMAVQNLSSPY